MAKFTATWTDTVVADWQSGDYFDETKFREQFGQNIEYVKAAIDSITTSNYWQLYERYLQAGLVPGNPFA